MPLLAPVTETLALVCRPGGDRVAALQLADKYRLPLLTEIPAKVAWALVFDPQGVCLQPTDPALGRLRVDFVGGKMGYRRRRQEAKPTLAKALGIKAGQAWQLWDMTAGLGQDAFVLASLGCQVRMFERHPIVHCLLADGLGRARTVAEQNHNPVDAEFANTLSRLTLEAGDGREQLLDTVVQPPALIYLDPMFPPRKKSAKVKNAMQVFHQLVGEDGDADELLASALQVAEYRVVVKRAAAAPPLQADRQPGFQLGGKTVRFDVYPLKAMN